MIQYPGFREGREHTALIGADRPIIEDDAAAKPHGGPDLNALAPCLAESEIVIGR